MGTKWTPPSYEKEREWMKNWDKPTPTKLGKSWPAIQSDMRAYAEFESMMIETAFESEENDAYDPRLYNCLFNCDWSKITWCCGCCGCVCLFCLFVLPDSHKRIVKFFVFISD